VEILHFKSIFLIKIIQRTFKAALKYLVQIFLPDIEFHANTENEIIKILQKIGLNSTARIANLLEIIINSAILAYCGSFLTEYLFIFSKKCIKMQFFYLYGITRLHKGNPINFTRKLITIISELIFPVILENLPQNSLLISLIKQFFKIADFVHYYR